MLKIIARVTSYSEGCDGAFLVGASAAPSLTSGCLMCVVYCLRLDASSYAEYGSRIRGIEKPVSGVQRSLRLYHRTRPLGLRQSHLAEPPDEVF